jgi:hypothetical protein
MEVIVKMTRPKYQIYRDVQGSLIAMRSDVLATSSVVLTFKTAEGDGVRLTVEEIPALVTALNDYYDKHKSDADAGNHLPGSRNKHALLESRKKTVTIPQLKLETKSSR